MSLSPRPKHVSVDCLPGCGIAGVCDRCTVTLMRGKKRWCSDSCRMAYYLDHIFNYAKAAVRRRDRNSCVMCDVKGYVEVDHIERAWGQHNVHSCVHHRANLRCLCAFHHKQVTAAQRAGEVKVKSLTRWTGGFLCCICFDPVDDADAWADESGQKWDMCKGCGAREAKA